MPAMSRFLLIAVSVLIVVAILWWLRRRKTAVARASLAPKPLEFLFDMIDATPDEPINFGYKISWLAVNTSDANMVVKSLNIENVQPANWRTGLIAAYNGHTFVAPSLNGWVFVISQKLPELGHEADSGAWSTLLSGLSRKFGDVQYFATHRVVEYHAWACFTDGKEIRAFAYLGERGETLADRGETTPGEHELGYDYLVDVSTDASSDAYWERDDVTRPDEDHVMEVAGKWSIKPNSLEDLDLPRGIDWIGNLVESSR